MILFERFVKGSRKMENGAEEDEFLSFSLFVFVFYMERMGSHCINEVFEQVRGVKKQFTREGTDLAPKVIY